MALFNVHVFAEIRQLFKNVEAPDQASAPLAAIKTEEFRSWMACFKSSTEELPAAGEFAEGFPGFMVDHAGDPEYSKSQFYFDTGDPYVELVRKLIAWADDKERKDSQLMALIEGLRGENLQTISG